MWSASQCLHHFLTSEGHILYITFRETSRVRDSKTRHAFAIWLQKARLPNMHNFFLTDMSFEQTDLWRVFEGLNWHSVFFSDSVFRCLPVLVKNSLDKLSFSCRGNKRHLQTLCPKILGLLLLTLSRQTLFLSETMVFFDTIDLTVTQFYFSLHGFSVLSTEHSLLETLPVFAITYSSSGRVRFTYETFLNEKRRTIPWRRPRQCRCPRIPFDFKTFLFLSLFLLLLM